MIRGVLTILNSSFCLFQNLHVVQPVIGLDLCKVDGLGSLNNKIRLIGSGIMIPKDLELLGCLPGQNIGKLYIAVRRQADHPVQNTDSC